MKITQNAFSLLCLCTKHSTAETGGIMGSLDGNHISEIIPDIPTSHRHRCCYTPNVTFLNRCIAEWQQSNIHFMGLFHTHFFNIKTLSQADLDYIKAIMADMPNSIQTLYFPIFILPNQELVSYRAERISHEIIIEDDILEII